MTEIEEEQPILANSLIKISKSKVKQIITFYYNDPTEIYYSYVKAGLLEDLLEEVTTNMQSFLSQDSFKVNSLDIPLIITDSRLTFHKKKKTKPAIVFEVENGVDFKLENSGTQLIELTAEKEILDYPITSTWKFPGKILSIESPLKHKITGFQVDFRAVQGDQIGGDEIFSFFYKIRNSSYLKGR